MSRHGRERHSRQKNSFEYIRGVDQYTTNVRAGKGLLAKLKTQKAKGIIALWYQSPFHHLGVEQAHLEACNIRVFPTLDKNAFRQMSYRHLPDLLYPYFARPCPTVPRHGFVESRIVKDAEEFLDVVEETLREDPQGEVVMMKTLSGKWSAVVNHAGVSFGLGHDGATMGKRTTQFIPSYIDSKDFTTAVGTNLCEAAGIKESPYLEYVEYCSSPMPVQLRDGPESPRSKNFIPKKMKVKNVVHCLGTEDLLEWETKVKNFGSKPGTVIWHPGGTMTSHFAVHAIINRIPFIVDEDCPVEGKFLHTAEWTPPELTKADCDKIAQYIRHRLDNPKQVVEELHNYALTAVSTLHASPQWGNDELLLRLRAEGLAGTILLTAAACVGEVRHWYDEGPGSGYSLDISGGDEVSPDDCPCSACKNKRAIDAGHEYTNVVKPSVSIYADKTIDEMGVLSRASAYRILLEKNTDEVKKLLSQCVDDFSEDGWSNDYGGQPWARAAQSCLTTIKVVEEFLANPNPETWSVAAHAYNRLINTCHNNGAILTKWLTRLTMDRIHLYPGIGLLNEFVADVIKDLAKQQVAIAA